ncbi:MAG: hypothetical protein HOY71_14795 [Nonomuraea sp.]|nr:hypothetical protein [Nonomuraea sp.]
MTVQAALASSSDTGYLFRGDGSYTRYDGPSGAQAGSDDVVAQWHGLPRSPDAAVYWSFDKVYFFVGGDYYRYDLGADAVEPGYPRPVAGNWPGLPGDGVDAAVNWGNGKVYFFRGGDYYRYDMTDDRVDPGYPRPIAGNWPGVWEDRVGAVLYQGGSQAYFFRDETYRRYDLANDKVDEEGAVAALRLAPVPSGSMLAARHLTQEQANGLVVDLIGRGLVSLKGGVTRPAVGARVVVQPTSVNGMPYTNQVAPGASLIDNVDQRMLVVLYRLTRWINSSHPDVSEILHLGIGHGSGPPNDCHNQGRALDLSGVVGSDDGTPFRKEVLKDWGNLPATGGIRLDAARDPVAYLLFTHVYTFASFECESNGIGPQNHWPPPPLGGSGFVIYPDYGGDPALRSAHQNHFHMQVGPTRV